MWTCAILILFLQGRHSKDCLDRLLLYVSTVSVKDRGSIVRVKRREKAVHLRNRCHEPANLADVDSEGI